MASILDFLDPFGIEGNVVWDLLKIVYHKITRKPLKEIFYEAFKKSLQNSPELIKYSPDKSIEFNFKDFKRLMDFDFNLSDSNFSPTKLNQDQIINALAELIFQNNLILIGGNTLSKDDYIQLLRNVLRQANVIFVQDITNNEEAFRVLLLQEAMNAKVAIEEVSEFLSNQFSITWVKLDEISGKLDRILALLERLTPTIPQIFEETWNFTHNVVDSLIQSRKLSSRPDLNDNLLSFLSTSLRFGFLRGSSGTGKSMLLASNAESFFQENWATILVTADQFEVRSLLPRIGENYLPAGNIPPWDNLLKPWLDYSSDYYKGLLFLIDAPEESDFTSLVKEIKSLIRRATDLNFPSNNLKIVITCHELFWDILTTQLEISPTRSQFLVIEVIDFSDMELDEALKIVGANHLLKAQFQGGPPDPYSESFREQLKHPATFEYYAELLAAGANPDLHNLTWSRLAELYLNDRINKAFSSLQKRPRQSLLIELLISFADLSRRSNTRNFFLPRDLIQQNLPDLEVEELNPLFSKYAALRKVGLLIEISVNISQQNIGFYASDMGSYLLSFTLREEFSRSENKHITVKKWLDESRTFIPIIDAFLVLIDRLVTEDPLHPTLISLLKTFAELRDFYSPNFIQFYRLLNPNILITLFELRNIEVISFAAPLDFFNAARAVRFTPQNSALVRQKLRESDPYTIRLAIELAGKYRDPEAASALIGYLDHTDIVIVQEARSALRKIGLPATPALLQIIQDRSQLASKRILCLEALSIVGYRSLDITTQLEACLQEGQEGNLELLSAAVEAAANLRDLSNSIYARETLVSSAYKDAKLLNSAAVLLAIEPSSSDFPAISHGFETLSTLWKSDNTQFPHLLLSNILKTLSRIDQADAKEFLHQILTQCLNQSNNLHPYDAIQFIAFSRYEYGFELLLDDLSNQFKTQLFTNSGRLFEVLSQIWEPNILGKLKLKLDQIKHEGFDLLEALLQNILQALTKEPSTGETYYNFWRNLDTEACTNLLHFLAKCRIPDLVSFAGQILRNGRWSLNLEIYDLFWLSFNQRAESFLLEKLNNLAPLDEDPSNSDAWNEKIKIVNALGTCASTEGGKAVLTFLQSENNVPETIPFNVLIPLLKSDILTASQLVAITKDVTIPVVGRCACIIALGIIDPSSYQGLYIDIISKETDPIIIGYAVRMLGRTSDLSNLPLLQDLVKSHKASFVVGSAAIALAQLNSIESFPIIEQALLKLENQNNIFLFIEALRMLAQPSSGTFLIKALEDERLSSLQYNPKFVWALEAFCENEEVQTFLLSYLKIWRGPHISFGDQIPALEALAKGAPAILIENVLQLYRKGKLYPATRQALAKFIPHFASQDFKTLTEQEFSDLLNIMLCDRGSLETRLLTQQYITLIKPELQENLHSKLSNSQDVWERACGISMLGYRANTDDKIKLSQINENPIIRHYADLAIKTLSKQKELNFLIEEFMSEDMTVHLASFLSLAEQGEELHLRKLSTLIEPNTILYAQYILLHQKITSRLNKERDEIRVQERDFLQSYGLEYVD